MRRLIAFPCDGETLVGSLDEAPGTTGLLIVSGGNEVRHGAHRGMALLAASVAAAGHPVFRFDRRGIGDSTGTNAGFLSSAPDIAAAAALFRREAPTSRLVAYGNCDAATALALFGRAAELDAIVLANPWAIENTDDLPPAAAIRAHYAERLKRPAEWRRLLTGGVNPSKLLKGLAKILMKRSQRTDSLADCLFAALTDWGDDARIILAAGDNTAIAFRAAAGSRPLPECTTFDTASHSFARPADQAALTRAILAALA